MCVPISRPYTAPSVEALFAAVRVMGGLAEIELRLVSCWTLFLAYACMAAACVVFLWDVIMQYVWVLRMLSGRSGVCGAVWLHQAGRICRLVCWFVDELRCSLLVGFLGRLVHALVVFL